jgi:glutathione S-transferase
MSELTLHGPISSFCSRRVLIVAKELGIDLKVVTVDVAGAEHKSEGYVTSKQPFGQFPVLEVC